MTDQRLMNDCARKQAAVVLAQANNGETSGKIVVVTLFKFHQVVYSRVRCVDQYVECNGVKWAHSATLLPSRHLPCRCLPVLLHERNTDRHCSELSTSSVPISVLSTLVPGGNPGMYKMMKK